MAGCHFYIKNMGAKNEKATTNNEKQALHCVKNIKKQMDRTKNE